MSNFTTFDKHKYHFAMIHIKFTLHIINVKIFLKKICVYHKNWREHNEIKPSK